MSKQSTLHLLHELHAAVILSFGVQHHQGCVVCGDCLSSPLSGRVLQSSHTSYPHHFKESRPSMPQPGWDISSRQHQGRIFWQEHYKTPPYSSQCVTLAEQDVDLSQHWWVPWSRCQVLHLEVTIFCLVIYYYYMMPIFCSSTHLLLCPPGLASIDDSFMNQTPLWWCQMMIFCFHHPILIYLAS